MITDYIYLCILSSWLFILLLLGNVGYIHSNDVEITRTTLLTSEEKDEYDSVEYIENVMTAEKDKVIPFDHQKAMAMEVDDTRSINQQ